MDEGKLGRRELLRLTGVMGIGSFTLSLAPQALAQTLSRGRQAPAAGPQRPVVVIDPGHGGVDPGTIGVSGVYEKDVVFEIAQEVARQLDATRRYRVVLTRTTDEFVQLQDRVARARSSNGDLFLSLHADAIPNPAVRGASVFTLSEQASDRQAAELAARENKADMVAGIDLSRHAPEVSNILLDLARRQTNNMSIGLARKLVGELAHDVRMMQNSHRSAGFAVLKALDIPSALVELGCLSNREEDALLRATPYQRKVSSGIVRSVNGYFDIVAKA
jgi:N-acetylmuramoyl-L-alanine amidase